MHPPLTGSSKGPATFKHRSCEAEVITNGIGDIVLSMITIMDTTVKATKLHCLNETSNFWLILAAHSPEVTSKKSIATEKFSTVTLPALEKERNSFMNDEKRMEREYVDRRVLLTQDGCGPEMNALLDCINSATAKSLSSSSSSSSSSLSNTTLLYSCVEDGLLPTWLECIKFLNAFFPT